MSVGVRTKCIAETQKGAPCSRWAIQDRYCRQHYLTPEEAETRALFDSFIQVFEEAMDRIASVFDDDEDEEEAES